MDESTLRIYFRRVLAVPPGASRKVLRAARDRRAALWREKMLVGPAEQKQLSEQRLSITNMAYDALSDSVRFKTYFTRMQAGVETLPELDELLAGLGEASPKPPPQRVVEKRLAAVHERMQRIQTLIESAIRQSVETESKRLQENAIPDSDEFYDSVYAAAIASGQQVKADEVSAAAKSKIDLDEHCLAELDALVTDTSEMAAHKAYDKLEAQVAVQVPAEPANRSVALSLSLLILVLVFGAAYFALNKDPGSFLASNSPNAAAPLTAADAQACENAERQNLLASENATIASGGGLIAPAGAAGLGGSANDVTEEGQIFYHEGVKEAISGDKVKALASFEQAYKLSPKLTLALYNKAALLAIAGQAKAAISAYSEVLSSKPNLAQAYYNRGLAHQNLASQIVSLHGSAWRSESGLELQRAIANYDQCLKLNGRCAQAFYNRGFAYYCLGQFEPAWLDFEKAQNLLPMLEAAKFNKNVIAAVLKKPVDPIASAPPSAPIGPVGPPWQ
jgi:tetratricopeptide (TPR) repeat protein